MCCLQKYEHSAKENEDIGVAENSGAWNVMTCHQESSVTCVRVL
jgi:hypothetical protein